jgi:DNA invertase Pin-like site-specific DNA recombinase
MTPRSTLKAPAVAPKAYSYLRFSTPEQSKGDSHRRQTQLAADYALRNSLALDTELTFHDLGVSAFRGTNAETGRLGDFLEAVKAGHVAKGSYLLVESLDRLSRRSARKALRVLEDIVETGITVVTLADGREYTESSLNDDPTSLIMSILIFMRANEESATKARRVKAAWQNKRNNAKNKPLTEWCPSWLTFDKATSSFVIVEERAEIVQRIYGETLQGVSPQSLVFALNAEGVPVFGRGQFWHRSFIDRLLCNPTVIGTLTPHTISYVSGRMKRTAEETVPNYYPAVIDEALFQRVQSLRDGARRPMRGRNAEKEVSNIFGGGMARCARCGASLVRVNKGTRNRPLASLVCSAAKVGAGCVYESATYQQVEDAFLRDVPRLVARAPVGNSNKKLDKEIDSLEASIEGSSAALENLINSLAISRSAAVEARIREVEMQIDADRLTLAELERKRADASGPIVQSRLDDLLEVAETEPLDRNRINALLRQNLSRVELDYDTRSLLLTWKQGGEARVIYGAGK